MEGVSPRALVKNAILRGIWISMPLIFIDWWVPCIDITNSHPLSVMHACRIQHFLCSSFVLKERPVSLDNPPVH